jgi:hypothetical protein
MRLQRGVEFACAPSTQVIMSTVTLPTLVVCAPSAVSKYCRSTVMVRVECGSTL